ncbi:leukocyte receptor cluster member 1 homolog [Actinia tenebrosa]|uniref:Leukocyte receptor cluster member 1 homolog n=1 Tax=Actinia tenebrosa TaxID=6105 RepID=A0A6P8IF57_ACTTE|nr:leukocyte receptor cluster member 1 homolog [Actinia tenebrosa]
MNILHHKSWHVRNKDNIERVRKDEENARLEEEKKAKRAALADQEARTALLRDRAKGSKSKELTNDSKSSSSPGLDLAPVSISDQQKHINFFEDIEEGLRQGNNPEYEAEKKAEQEKQEKAIGLLTYLGQSASEKHSDKPWYIKKDHQKKATDNDNSRDMKRKDALDPLNKMKKYLEAHEKHKHKKHKKEHKHSKSRKEKRREETSPRKKSVQELRAERLKREQSERIRESELRSSSKGEKKAPEPLEDNPYRYNSQFNPDLVRKPHSSHRYRPY